MSNKKNPALPLGAPALASLGRVVIFQTGFPEEHWNGATEHAAMITGVVAADIVHLTVFPAGAAPAPRLNVRRAGSFAPIDGFPSHSWKWPTRI